jgi:tRNA nucleotidyltransferase/poly(A) polymerase
VTQDERATELLGLNEPPLSRVLDMLDGNGEEARVVGGAVRNALMGLPRGDIDIATTALPDEVVKRARAAGFKTVPTGIEHGTVTIVGEGSHYEVTTLREDIETYGRKAKVAFGRDWKRDAERRDFTINALSMSRDGKVHDHVNGLPDIAAKRVRFVGDPATRIAEDYLRILRLFRFHAIYGVGDLDPAGLAASIAARDGLETLSRERVRMETMKLLSAPRAAATLEVMADAGILLNVLGGVARVDTVARMKTMESTVGVTHDTVRALAALGVAIVEDAERLRQRLRLSNDEDAHLTSMADRWWQVTASMSEAQARTLLYRLHPERYVDRVMLAWARSQSDTGDVEWRTLARLPQRWTAPAFPLKAADFIARGVAKGPALGKALAGAEADWIAADFPGDPAALESLVTKYSQVS